MTSVFFRLIRGTAHAAQQSMGRACALVIYFRGKEDGNGFVCDLWCLCPAVTRASQMLWAFGCSNMLLSKGLKQAEDHWNYYTRRCVSMPRKDTASKTGNGILFLALQLPGGFGRLLRISRPWGLHPYSGDVGMRSSQVQFDILMGKEWEKAFSITSLIILLQ